MSDKTEKKKNIKNNLEYFWTYYKLPFAAVMIVVILVLYFLVTSLTAKDTALSVMLIDCHSEMSGEKMAEEYMEASGLDQKKYQVQIQNNLMFQGTDSGNYSMTSLSKFMADIGSELLDVCGMLKDDFVKYDGSETWMDLHECLTDEQLETLKDKLLTTDDGRVIGIMADDLPVMQADGCYTNEETDAAIGIIYNTPHKDEAVKYLLYLAGVM
ncbi:hypothetical protein [Blautia sp. MSJ-19]|uniref:hypothetical protein n=1 Tax=Blautia sp. MSJ-19 TaxID=2841517 RepID=UPI001C0E9090|nr:hypothetical protein [Blautia sp. MSJ-19]MBU5480970.1 hypothetical protein [Blautia sp. MSJ-19]